MIRLEEITIIDAPIQRCFDLARSVEVHLAGNIHFGEQAVAIVGVTSGLPESPEHVTWRARHFGIWQDLTSEITVLATTDLLPGHYGHGTFRSMQADHHFRTLPSGATEMKDVFRSPPLFPFSAP